MSRPRKQCKACPWKKGTNPREIPDGYSEEQHRELKCTIAKPGSLQLNGVRMMACHETPPGEELPCVGWLANQLGPGQNIGLRLAVFRGSVDTNVETVGPQHSRFEQTLPKKPRARIAANASKKAKK